MRGLRTSFYAVVGQIELIGKSRAVASRPSARSLGAHCSRPTAQETDQCQLEPIGKVSAFSWQANAGISLGSHPVRYKLCGPTRQSRAVAQCVPIGQCELLSRILWRMGLYECLRAVAFRLPWPSPSSSGMEANLHQGPM
jgi:hypothetical protein